MSAFTYVLIAYFVLKKMRNSRLQIQLTTLHCSGYKKIIQRFAEEQRSLFTVYIKHTEADVIFLPLNLGNTTLILNKEDFVFVSLFPCLLEHPVILSFNPILVHNTSQHIGCTSAVHLTMYCPAMNCTVLPVHCKFFLKYRR